MKQFSAIATRRTIILSGRFVSCHLTIDDSLNNDKSLSVVLSSFSFLSNKEMRNSGGQQSETAFEETYAAGADGCASEPTRRAIFHFTHLYSPRRRETFIEEKEETIKENEPQSRPIGHLSRFD